jgi:N-acyl homoserine lactone hydrolase
MTLGPVPRPPEAARRMYPMWCGFEVADTGVAYRGQGGQMESAPIGVFAVDTGEGVVLVDSGANEEIVWDPDQCPLYYTPFRQPVIRESDTLLARLDQVGISPRDVTHVIITHMHGDHSGGIRHFPQAKIILQRPEYEYAMSMTGLERDSSRQTGTFPRHSGRRSRAMFKWHLALSPLRHTATHPDIRRR